MFNETVLSATAKYLSENTNLRIILIMRIIIAFTGIILSIILLHVQGRYMIIHKNAQALLVSHHIFEIMHCASSISINAFDLIRFAQHYTNPHDYLVTTIFAVSIRTPFLITMAGTIWALFTMALERIIATYNYQTYEQSGRRSWSYILVALQWILSMIVIGIMIMNSNWNEIKVQITVISDSTTAIASHVIKFMAGVELCTICLLLGLLHYNLNKKKRMRESSLTEKYQIDENIRSIRLMLPMVITHFCCFMPLLIAFPIYYWIDAGVDPGQYAIFLEAFGTTVLYSALLPLVLFWRHKVLRDNFRKSIGAFDRDQPEERRESRSNRGGCDHERHFELLETMWNE